MCLWCKHTGVQKGVNSHTLHNFLLQAVLTAAVESGYDQVLCTPSTAAQVAKWQELASFNPLNLQPDGTITDAGDQQVSSSSSSSNWVLGLVVSGVLAPWMTHNACAPPGTQCAAVLLCHKHTPSYHT